MKDRRDRKRPIWRILILAILFIAIMGVTLSGLMFSTWSEFETVSPQKVAAAFDAELAQLKDQRAYISISESGVVTVRRDLEQQNPAELVALNLLANEPGNSKLLRMRFPFWFVKLKTSRDLNLGTFVTFLSRDWEHLDLKVTEDDLMERGRGLVLDHTRSDGARIVLWSE